MNFFKIILILIVFLKTGNVLSEDNIFNVNNIEIIKKNDLSNDELANQAIKKGFIKLIDKILLRDDQKQLSKLSFEKIKNLVSYYQVITTSNNSKNEKIRFNIFFDKDKLHSLFYSKGILYSEVSNKEIYILPIFFKEEKVFVYNQNFFYENWNEIYDEKLLEFIIPFENIEVLQNINSNKENLLSLDLRNLFQEYTKKNLALVIIEDTNSPKEKIYLRAKISGKMIDKNLILSRENLIERKYYEKIIRKISYEIANIVKSQNLVDIRTPSFLNTKFIIKGKYSLLDLNNRMKKIDSINNIYVQELTNKNALIRIKYLGKIDKIIKELENQNIILKLSGDDWSLSLRQ